MSRVLVRRIKGQLLGCAYPRNIFQPQAGDCLGGFQQRCGWMGLPPWNPLVSCCRGACPPQLLSWTPSQQPTPSSQATEFSPQKGTTKSFSVCSPLGPALRYTLWFLGAHHPEVTRGQGSPPGRSPRCSRGAQPFCVSPACGSSHTVAPPRCRMAGRNVCSMQSAWRGHCPLRGPGTIPLAGPGSATCVPFPASRGPGEARGEDLKVWLDQGAGQLSVRRRQSW